MPRIRDEINAAVRRRVLAWLGNGESNLKILNPFEEFYGKRCIIRCRDAGVHYGVVRHIEGRTVVLDDARRIWRWRGALTLSHLATESTPLDVEYTRLAPRVASMPLLDAAEVIPLVAGASARLDCLPDWRK